MAEKEDLAGDGDDGGNGGSDGAGSLFERDGAGGDDGGAVAGHPAAGTGNADGGTADAGAGEGAKPGEPGARPAFIQEKFWDAEKGEIRVEALAKSHADTQAELTRTKQSVALDKDDVPKEAADYLREWKLPEVEGLDAERLGDVSSDDFLLNIFAEVSKEEGIGKARFERMSGKLLAAISQHMPEPVDLEAERAKLGGGDKAKAVIAAAQTWVASLSPKPTDQDTGRSPLLNADEAKAVEALSTSAAGISALMKMRELAGEKPIPMDPSMTADGVMTPEEVYSLMGERDDKGRVKYELNGPEGDRWRAHVDEQFRRTFGTGRGGATGRVLPRGAEGNS